MISRPDRRGTRKLIDDAIAAALLLSGDVGVSLFNMLVAAHTFTTVCLHKTWSNLLLSMFIALTWILMIVISTYTAYELGLALDSDPAAFPFRRSSRSVRIGDA